MKLVASAKLRKAQNAIEAMRPYEAELQRILALAGGVSLSGIPASASALGASVSGSASGAPASGSSGGAAGVQAPDVSGSASGAPASGSSASGVIPAGAAACAETAPFAHGLASDAGECAKSASGAYGLASDAGECAKSASGAYGHASFAYGRTAIVAIASDSSLCGGFNANAIAKVRAVRSAGDTVFSVGRKMADAMRKDGFPQPEMPSDLAAGIAAMAEHPSYGAASALVQKLMDDVDTGRYSRVLIVHNHFVSTARQVPVVEQLYSSEMHSPSARHDTDSIIPSPSPVAPGSAGDLGSSPVAPGSAGDLGSSPVAPGLTDASSVAIGSSSVIPGLTGNLPEPEANPDVIVEPSPSELVAQLLPKTVKLKLYAALLDSAAAEHAARTIAMQTATDNGENILQELTLQYNKGRQQKITAEILDLAGGQMQ